jgi:hypothetical protein
MLQFFVVSFRLILLWQTTVFWQTILNSFPAKDAHIYDMCYLQALVKLVPYYPRKGVLWKWLHDVIPCWLLHDILTRSLLWDLMVTLLMNVGRGGAITKCALCWLLTPLGNAVWNTERVICENCRLKGSLSNFLVEFSMLTWDGAGTSSYNEPSSHEVARSQLFVRCKMVTKRTSLEVSHVEQVTTTRVVEQANYMLSEGLMTHGGSTSLRWSEKESAKDMQMSERNFVTGLRTCL